MGVSRTCARRWFKRYVEHCWAGMEDRSSRPHSCPHATPEDKVDAVIAARERYREGPVELAERCQVPAHTVSLIIAKVGLPRLWELDSISGEGIRVGRATLNETPGVPRSSGNGRDAAVCAASRRLFTGVSG